MTQLSRSLSNLSLVLRDKNDSSLQSLKSANFEFSLMRKCFSCSQIHVLNGNSRKTKRNSINRAFSSDHINTNITTKLLKMIDLNAQQKCKLKFGFNNSVDMIPEISKDLENLDSESNDFIHSYRDFDQNNLDYEIYNKSNDNNDCLVSEELLSASRSVCDGLSPVDVSPSGYYSCELSQSVEGENWKFNSCENIDIKTEKNLSNLSECSSGITLTEEVTNYDKSNHQKSRSYRSNSSDSAVILPFNEFDFEDKTSTDSECSQFKFVNQNTSNTMNSNSQMGFRGNSTIYSNIWSHSLKTTSGSCPSLETPSVIISDHSTNHYEEKTDLKSCDENVLALAIESLINSQTQSPTLSLRRDSVTSIYSSTSSLSSLGEEDFTVDNNLLSYTETKKPSAWRKVRSLVTSPFIQTYKKHKYPWIQLAGHQGSFLSGQTQGTILKKISGAEEICFKLIMNDVIRPLVPEYKRTVTVNNENYLELQDLLANFENPSIMDIKMGVRTYLEEELTKAREKPKLRKDMYEKMIAIDPIEPTEDENQLKAVTKPRYMIWRETISSTASLGFRIEGVKLSNGKAIKDFKRTKTEEHVKAAFIHFIDNHNHCINFYLNKLKTIIETLKSSQFFKTHELIGSSLLFVHDNNKADIWLIDFAKTHSLPNGVKITHENEWQVGNHEDGFLIGMDSLIRIFSNI